MDHKSGFLINNSFEKYLRLLFKTKKTRGFLIDTKILKSR